jgi:hypothetical protein
MCWPGDVVFSGPRYDNGYGPGKVFCPLLWSVVERCEDLVVDFTVLLLKVARGQAEDESSVGGKNERCGIGNPLDRGRCTYHVHQKGGVCASSKDNVEGKIRY